MNEITGDKDFVLKLLKDTIKNLGEDRPQPKKTAMKRIAVADESERSTERDEIVERYQRAYERAQLESEASAVLAKSAKAKTAGGAKRAKGSMALTSTVVEEVWYAPRDRAIALFQSAMDEYLDAKMKTPKPPAGAKGAKTAPVRGKETAAERNVRAREAVAVFYGKEAPLRKAKSAAKTAKAFIVEQYDKVDPGWLTVAWEKAKLLFKGKHKFIKHKALTDFRYPLPEQTKIALLSDWGGGNEHARDVAEQVRKSNPDYVIHLGDVYYSGTDEEVRDRFLKYWPTPKETGRSFALNANHEMYSGGYGYFDTILKQFGQEASYFALENKHWRFIGLDTGYVEHNLNREQVDWLKPLLNTGSAKNILMSHHQPFSAFESAGAGEERLQSWLGPFMEAKKIYGWYWGHEHLLVLYKSYKNIKGRCIGNGCFPYGLPPTTPPYKGPQVEWVSRRPDPKRPGRGMHSFALCTLDGPKMHVEYIDQDGFVGKTEDF